MESAAAESFNALSPAARIVELATLIRRSKQLAAVFAHRGTIEQTMSLHGLFDRDRFATVDRRLMPDRLRVPPEIAELLLLEPTR